MMKKLSKPGQWIVLITLIFICSGIYSAKAQTVIDPSPPEETIKLIFIHHSVGENWLADDQGGLGLALQENNYFVSDTYYGWGPDGIGDRTDTMDWPEWFTGSDSQRYLDALYTESDANAAGYAYYSRTISDPGGENQVIMFKSCFPNSELGGSPNDPASPDEWMTVGAAKYVYNQLLDYFLTRPDKLFVIITPPPMQNIGRPENARAVSNWLVNDWLIENDYPLSNVAVFDFYNVLTHPDNHHRVLDGRIEHSTSAGSDTLYYDWDGDDHPNPQGGQKATAEFIPLLNAAVNRWQAGDTAPIEIISPEEPEAAEPEEAPTEAAGPEPEVDAPPAQPRSATTIDDFDHGPLNETDYWVPYWDEAVQTSIECDPYHQTRHQSDYSLEINFDVLSGSWASCELWFYQPQNWSSQGLQFYLKSTEAGLPYGLLFYYQQGDDTGTSVVELLTPQESVGGWVLVTIPWETFAEQDSLVYPELGHGMAFAFGGRDGDPNTGTLWIDSLGTITEITQQDTLVPAEEPGDDAEPEAAEEETQGSGGFCGSLPLLIGLVGFGLIGVRKKK